MPLGPPRLRERVEDLLHVVAVDHDGVPAEAGPATAVSLHVVAVLRRAALTEPVDVDDRAERVELVEVGHRRRFPHRPFRGFAIAHQHVGAVVGADARGIERDADARAQPLPERTGRDVHERQPRRGMSLEIRSQLTKLQQLLARDISGFRPGGVEQRRRMSFRQHEAIGQRVLGILRVVAHLRKEKRRDDDRPRKSTSWDGRSPIPTSRRNESMRRRVAMFLSAGMT